MCMCVCNVHAYMPYDTVTWILGEYVYVCMHIEHVYMCKCLCIGTHQHMYIYTHTIMYTSTLIYTHIHHTFFFSAALPPPSTKGV
jgi:hypothetical protein